MVKIEPSEITPEHIYLSRRKFIRGIGALVSGSLILTACGIQEPPPTKTPTSPPTPAAEPTRSALPPLSASGDELGSELTPFEAITNYNNYYEFAISKDKVARLAQNFRTSPWSVEVGGLVHKPRTFDLDDLRKFTQEERIYRLRCVEAWSMVVPWVGFPLVKLLSEAEPMSKAKYVRFETLYAPDQMPGQRSTLYAWPYVEGLRMDEAVHDLTILATGLYGKLLLPQNGAPVRLQEHQVHRQNRSGRGDAHVPVDGGCASRVRLFRQRESRGAPSPLVPGHRAPHRREQAHRNPLLERLCRRGGAPL